MVAAVAERAAEPVERRERDLRPSDLLRQLVGAPAPALGVIPPAFAPGEHAAQDARVAQLADEALALGQVGARLGRALDRVPVGAVRGDLRDRRLKLDLSRQVADLLRQRERLAVGLTRAAVVGLRDLEVMAERQQRADRLAVVGVARELDRTLEVLARLGGVADPPEHAPEDAVRAARDARLLELLGEPSAFSEA